MKKNKWLFFSFIFLVMMFFTNDISLAARQTYTLWDPDHYLGSSTEDGSQVYTHSGSLSSCSICVSNDDEGGYIYPCEVTEEMVVNKAKSDALEKELLSKIPSNQKIVGNIVWTATQVDTLICFNKPYQGYNYVFEVSLSVEAADQYTVSVSVDPAEAGSASGGGTFSHGDSVTVTSTPSDPDKYTFIGWYDGDSCVSGSESYTFTVTESVSLVAKYEEKNIEYIVSVSVDPPEAGTASGGGTYKKGDSVTVTTTPSDPNKYTFIGWYDGDNCVSSSESYTFTVTGNISLVAQYELKEEGMFQLTVNGNYSGVSTEGTGKYKAGTSATYSIDFNGIEDAEKNFLGWEVDGSSDLVTGTSGSVEMTKDIVVNAVYDSKGEEPEDPAEPEEPVHECTWSTYTQQPTSTTTPFHGSSIMIPDHCPDINNIRGNPLENLYYIGEKISLRGTNCGTRTTYTSGYTYDYCTGCGAQKNYSTIPAPAGYSTYYKASIKNISGIDLIFSDGRRFSTSDIQNSGASWSVPNDFYVKEWKDVHYSNKLGTSYGIIEVKTCASCQHKYYIPGPKPSMGKNTELVIHITPPNAGTVTVKYQYADETGKIQEKTETLTGNGGTIKVLEGSNVTIEVNNGENHTYINTTTKDGNIITLEDKYNYYVPSGGDEIYINFMPKDPERKYTLYVTSTMGGKATITEYPAGLVPEVDVDSFGVHKETVYKVDEGKEFIIEYEAEEGFVFSGWEYRPFIFGEESNGKTKIEMPASDLTVTAIFNRIPEKEQNPTLYVTTNNEEWGMAYVEMPNGDRLPITEAIPGTEYKVIFESKDGYYFTNWEYDSSFSPFKVVENEGNSGIIIMPGHDLEIKAIFAPIPTDPAITNHSVTFRPEPPEGGDVPEDIGEIITGATVTIAVTPHKGYEFDYWKFYNINGGEITPDNYFFDKTGTGYFIMPDYDVEAVAYFKYVGEPREITILIVGEGTVEVDKITVPSGGVIEAQDGDKLKLEGIPEEDWKFKYWITEDGEILSEDPNYIHEVDGDTTIIAVFEYAVGPYTLYVSSMYGGTAEIKSVIKKQGNYEYKIKSSGKDALGKEIFRIEKVYAGDRFEIEYEVTEDDYEFKFWEYKPFISPDIEENFESKGTIEITMPASDLTVTAVFENKEIKAEPKLSVTTNNPKWGKAWTTVGKEKTSSDKKYEAIPGTEYVLEYDEEDGYYFVNWNYSTPTTPFIDEDIIRMPNVDLEIMAMFSPIPEPAPDKEVDPEPEPNPEPDPVVGHNIEFRAEPSEGGKVPSNLENILPGSEVTVAVTVNRGWEFDYWKFETTDGERVYPTTNGEELQLTGTGSFIMPNYDIIATAVFREKEHYKLYVTHYYGGDAWTYDNDGSKTVLVEKAYEGEYYLLENLPNKGYIFDGYEFRWSGYTFDKGMTQQREDEKGNKYAVMPNSDMTVTAVFRKEDPYSGEPKVLVSTNNALWGDAWIVVDGEEYHSEWVNAIPGETYEVYYKPYSGYEFTNWSTTEYFEEYIDGVYRAIFLMPDKTVEIMAFFKPGEKAERKFILEVEAKPSDAGTASIGYGTLKKAEFSAGEIVTVDSEAYPGYEFRYWYTMINGEKVIVFYDEEYEFKMPAKDYKLIAYFKEAEGSIGEKNKLYRLSVEADPADAGRVGIENYVTKSKYVSGGELCSVMVSPNNTTVVIGGNTYKYEFKGWFLDGERKSTSMTYKFDMPKRDIHLVARFERKIVEAPKEIIKEAYYDSFKIVSVRDLKWKNYFIQNGKLNSDRYFNIPEDSGTMLKDVTSDGYKQPIKMGYAVEFELVTSGISLNDATLTINPKVFEAKDGEIVNNNDILSNGKLKSETIKDLSGYREIVIDANSKGSQNEFMEYSSDLNEKVNVGAVQISKNTILWRWVYYLPADTYIPKIEKSDKNSNEIVVGFDIKLQEKGNIAKDIVVNAQEVLGSEWTGKVFRYSLEESLLDDIYDNAQN